LGACTCDVQMTHTWLHINTDQLMELCSVVWCCVDYKLSWIFRARSMALSLILNLATICLMTQKFVNSFSKFLEQNI